MSQIFTIVDDVVVINKLSVNSTTGNVTHLGSINVKGTVSAESINADSLYVKNIVTENGGLDSIGEWKYNTEVELNGKGFTWAWDNSETKLIFRTGNRLWTNANLDLADGASFSIGDTPVLSASSLGETIVDSNLTSVGTLNELTVSGDVTLSEFVFVNSIYNRVGIGTDEPNASLSILDNNVEVILGSPRPDVAVMGTYTSHDVGIVSDNIIRINVKANGEVEIGNELSKTGVLRVYGTIYADTIQTDTRISRTRPLEFKESAESTYYGLGLNWVNAAGNKEFVLVADPDRFWSTESIDLDYNKSYFIGRKEVLSETALGASVVNSSLTSVGTLAALAVSGDVDIAGTATIANLNATSVKFGNVTINENGFDTAEGASITADGHRVLYSDHSQISIGDVLRRDKPVKVFGALSVGINNPDPSVNFSVPGDVSIGNKKFTNGMAAPTTGSFQIGDICWNTKPQANSYVGWICVAAGDPGEWLPFGSINLQ
jgi:hypothetical protein